MRLKRLVFSLVVSGAILNSSLTLAADPNQVLAKTNDNPAATLNYWTPDRLKSAKPFPIPKTDINNIQFLSAGNLNNEKSISVEGAPPQFKVSANSTPLYDIEIKPLSLKNSPSLQDRGTRNLNFTSSRLVPLTADITYPYSAVGKLFFSQGSSNFVCSASVIANRLVVTAGHCVHSGTSSGYYTNFLFIPAFRDGAAPFQRWTWSFVQAAPAWISGGGGVPNAGDFAILEMKDNVISAQTRTIASVTGKLGFATNQLANNHLHMLGYPCNFDSCAKMHQVTAQNGPAVAPNNVSYGSDMGGGSSGGPWVQNFGVVSTGQSGGQNPGRNQVVAVTSWGYTNPALMAQGAANFNNAFSNLYNQVCARQAGNC